MNEPYPNARLLRTFLACGVGALLVGIPLGTFPMAQLAPLSWLPGAEQAFADRIAHFERLGEHFDSADSMKNATALRSALESHLSMRWFSALAGIGLLVFLLHGLWRQALARAQTLLLPADPLRWLGIDQLKALLVNMLFTALGCLIAAGFTLNFSRANPWYLRTNLELLDPYAAGPGIGAWLLTLCVMAYLIMLPIARVRMVRSPGDAGTDSPGVLFAGASGGLLALLVLPAIQGSAFGMVFVLGFASLNAIAALAHAFTYRVLQRGVGNHPSPEGHAFFANVARPLPRERERATLRLGPDRLRPATSMMLAWLLVTGLPELGAEASTPHVIAAGVCALLCVWLLGRVGCVLLPVSLWVGPWLGWEVQGLPWLATLYFALLPFSLPADEALGRCIDHMGLRRTSQPGKSPRAKANEL